MRKILSGIFLGLALAFSLGNAQAETYLSFLNRTLAQGQAQNLFQPAVEQRLLALVNGYRITRGLRPLVDAPDLKNAARAHAADMALHSFLGHTATTGHDFDSRMHALRPGVMVLPSMAENAASMRPKGGDSEEVAKQLFQAWLNSPPHLRTMRSRDYLRIATGAAIYNGKAYADQIFVGPEVQTNVQQ